MVPVPFLSSREAMPRLRALSPGLTLRRSGLFLARLASTNRPAPTPQRTSAPEKTIVLEPPAKFNPPSHSSRLRRPGALPRHYAPRLSPSEAAAQRKKDYPGLLPPEGTWAHWLWTNPRIHLYLTVGTLFCLAVFTFFMNFVCNSPFKHLVPPISFLWTQPMRFITAWHEVIVLHSMYQTALTDGRRNDSLDDSSKGHYYRKMHGIKVVSPLVWLGDMFEEKPKDQHEAAAAPDFDQPIKNENRKNAAQNEP